MNVSFSGVYFFRKTFWLGFCCKKYSSRAVFLSVLVQLIFFFDHLRFFLDFWRIFYDALVLFGPHLTMVALFRFESSACERSSFVRRYECSKIQTLRNLEKLFFFGVIFRSLLLISLLYWAQTHDVVLPC